MLSLTWLLFILCEHNLYTQTLSPETKIPVNTVVDTIGGFQEAAGMAISANSKYLYVVDHSTNTLSVIDADLNLVVDNAIFAGTSPAELALAPNGKTLYISNENSPGSLFTIDTANLVPGPTVTELGDTPFGLAVTPNGKEIYIACQQSNQVDVFDVTSGKLLSPIPVGDSPGLIAFTPNGKAAYVTNFFGSTVSVIDVAKSVVEGSPIPVGRTPTSVNITPDGKTAYVLNVTSVSVIDTATNKVTDNVDLSDLTSNNGLVSALTPDGDYLYVPIFNKSSPETGPGSVVMISTATNRVVGTPVQVGATPIEVAIAPNYKHAYVTNLSGTVTVIEIVK